MTLSLRNALLATSKRMAELGLAPGTSGNISVRTSNGFLVTPSAIPYDALQPDDMVEVRDDGTLRPNQRVPSSEWQLHRDLMATRREAAAIVHTPSLLGFVGYYIRHFLFVVRTDINLFLNRLQPTLSILPGGLRYPALTYRLRADAFTPACPGLSSRFRCLCCSCPLGRTIDRRSC